MAYDLAIYGAGGLGREFAEMVEQINEKDRIWDLKGFFDDGFEKGFMVDDYPILGGIDALNMWQNELNIVVAVADPNTRKKIVESVFNPRIKFPALVHPQALIGSRNNQFGPGCVVTAGCILTVNIQLGKFVIVNLSTTIGHDSHVGSFSSIMPGCNISGNVKIGDSCLIGTGVKILQNLSLGKNCIVGAGAVVTKNFSDNQLLIGIPAASLPH